MLDQELWQQSEDVKGLRDNYHSKAIGHMIVLNGLADQLIDTKRLAKNSEDLLKERTGRFEKGSAYWRFPLSQRVDMHFRNNLRRGGEVYREFLC